MTTSVAQASSPTRLGCPRNTSPSPSPIPIPMLAAMFDPESERPPARKDDQGNFFLDGEPEPFKFILQFLRRGRLVNYLLTEMGRTISSFLSLLWSPHFQSRPGKPRGSPLQCGGRASRALREGDRHHRTAAHRRAGQGDHREEHTGKEKFDLIHFLQEALIRKA